MLFDSASVASTSGPVQPSLPLHETPAFPQGLRGRPKEVRQDEYSTWDFLKGAGPSAAEVGSATDSCKA
jgi:hypothetical protein